MHLKINGRKHWLWRAVDQDGVVLDILVQPRRNQEAAEAFAPRVPGAQLCLVGAGHAPWIDTPQLVALTTASFLAGHDD